MTRVAGVIAAVVLTLLLGLPAPSVASPGDVNWTKVSIPGEEEAGHWILAPGSDIRQLAIADDGTLYACCQGLDSTLYKSTDGGYRWHDTGVNDDIAAIATVPGSASAIYYATRDSLARSTDSGSGFTQIAELPGGAGSGNREVTAIDVSGNLVAVALRDRDAGEFGGVYIRDQSHPFSDWIDTGIGSYDVYAIAFSPHFATDQQLVAVITDETDTSVTTRIGGNGWGQTVGNARLTSDGAPVAVSTGAAIAFPQDYDISNSYAQFVAISTGDENGDVYVINRAGDSSVATDLNIGAGYGLSSVDVSGLAVGGASLLAGASGSADVYLSNDGGGSWEKSAKPPTGQSRTCIVSGNGRAYAATSGSGSAVSVTSDSGMTWNQTGLIDTDIRDIISLAPSPLYSQDSTLFMLTWGSSGHSLWRTTNGGQRWERVYAASFAGGNEIDRIELPPGYGASSQVVYIAGSSNGSPVIWQSVDNGQSFIQRSAPSAVDTWALASEQTVFIGSYDGSNGRVYRTTNSGLSYSAGAAAGSQPLNSIALSAGGYVLVSNANGWVYFSGDSGASFEPVPPGATSPPFTGMASVAFDPGFSDNHIIYAASDTASTAASKERIYRFQIGTSTIWERLDSTLPVGSMLGQVKLTDGGALYATSFKANGGMERCLNPADPFPTFETVTGGLDDGATLTGLWLSGNRLWAIDTTNTSLLVFTDTLATPVTLTSPPDGAADIGRISGERVTSVSLTWAGLGGATGYQWQVDYEADLPTIPTGLEGNTGATSIRLPSLETGTDYYWRVRATSPLLSPWSAVWSFTTASPTAETPTPKPSTPKATTEPSPTPEPSPSPTPPPSPPPTPAAWAGTGGGTEWSMFISGTLITALAAAVIALLIAAVRTHRRP